MMHSKSSYPSTLKDSIVDDFFGELVADPYRWLENSVDDDTSRPINKWVEEQSELANSYLNQIPWKPLFTDRLNELWNYERISSPFEKGSRMYYFKNDGLQDQSVLFQSIGEDAFQPFIDPNSFSEDGTESLSGLAFSKDGSKVAYQVSSSGSDWSTVYVKDCQTGQLLSDTVSWLRYSSVSWLNDGFFYSSYGDQSGQDQFTKSNQGHKVFYHKLGTDQGSDVIVYQDKEHAQRNHNIQVTYDESFIIMSVTESTSGNALYVKPVSESGDFTQVVSGFDHDFEVIGNVGNRLLVLTNYNAPKKQLIGIDVSKVSPADWVSIIPEGDFTLNSVDHIGGHLVANRTEGISNTLTVYNLQGEEIGGISLGGVLDENTPRSVSAVNGHADKNIAYFSVSSFVLPSTIMRVDVSDRQSSIWKKPTAAFEPSDYEVRYTEYPSKDGTLIPVSIIHKKGISLDGKRPTLLYGYGGFNISILPRFALTRLPLLEQGGVYAVANIRGGGEKGTEWHQAGTQLQKQNVFDDFIAAAEFLIEEGYTSSTHLAIEGRSNGGLLVGACMTQRPELYRVAFPIVGVLDMLRYHQFTIGHFWASDYGRSDDSTQFANLYSYSPVHNVKEVDYPATMVMTADHDDRVVPAHSFKFGAALQAKNTSVFPILLRIDRKAGHGAGKPISMQIEEEADKLSFMLYHMDIHPSL